jgi:hypothetical protein
MLCLPALLGAGSPEPLVTGAVRDQFGDPVASAVVTAGPARTSTDAAGTFALETHSASVTITCDYCHPTSARVDSDGTVAAIVQRYQAVAVAGTSTADIRALPYARVESAFSLQPFVVLNESSRVLPGPRLMFYGISKVGGLLVDDGIPSYDIAAGVTPLRTVPAFDETQISASDQNQAYRYGDQAAGGTFFVQTRPPQAHISVLNGTERALNAGGHDSSSAFNVAGSADDGGSRARADGSLQWLIGNDTLSASAMATNDDTNSNGIANSSMTALRVHYERTRAVHSYADFIADRAGYLSSSGSPVTGEWNDLSLQTGMSSTSRIATFADVGVRVSNGYYDPSAFGLPSIAGKTLQAHLTFGASAQFNGLSWQVGASAFDVRYTGGSSGISVPLSARILAPSATISYDITPAWNLAIDANLSFRLPTLLETYGYGADESALHFDRFAQRDAKLTYTDRRRLRASLIAVDTHVSNLDNGTVRAAGASLAWQVAPQLSVRAWTLHFDDSSQPYAPIFRFGASPLPATPASIWTTYENAHGFRADVVWRRDLLDYRAQQHLDASIGGPLASGFRWFIGSERRQGRGYISAGIRLGP